MSIAELQRVFKSKRRVSKIEAKERASYDYILADLVGRSIGRFYSSSNKFPSIEDAYPSLFDSQEIQEQKAAKRQELSILRFKQFTESFNKKFQGGSDN